MNSPIEATIKPEQLSHIEMNLQLSIDERIDQLQNAVNLIEEMRASLDSLDSSNEN